MPAFGALCRFSSQRIVIWGAFFVSGVGYLIFLRTPFYGTAEDSQPESLAKILLQRMGLANVKPILQGEREYEGDDEVLDEPDLGDGVPGKI
jgi:hypothetical protein